MKFKRYILQYPFSGVHFMLAGLWMKIFKDTMESGTSTADDQDL
jgi:hypothetical protein